MTRPPSDTLAEYRHGLEDQLSLLVELLRAAEEQMACSVRGTAEALDAASAERTRLMAALLTIEQRQRPIRAELHRGIDAVRRLDGFAAVANLHRLAEECLRTIEAQDARLRDRLIREQDARCATAHTLDAGEVTLAAYRKVLTSGMGGAVLVDRHG